MSIFITYFTNTQVILLVVALITFLSGLLCHIKEKENLAVGFLILTALSVFSFSALLDPFLNLWDERFHALVGKNLMNHPLMPTLYDDPVVNMAYDRWDRYHIWLHKQPLFLWQIALSFKLFGISEFTLRLPNVVLGAILVFIGYRSGRLMVNKRVGFITGVFDYILNLTKKVSFGKSFYKFIFAISVVILVLLRFDIEFLQEKYTTWKESNSYTRMLRHNKEIFKSLDLPDNTVLFNVKGRHYIEAMFYTGFPSYNFIPSKDQYEDLKEKEKTITIIAPTNTELPEYLKNDTTVIKINKVIKGYD